MIKPGSLREHLNTAIPELRLNPEQLMIFIDSGSIVSTAVPGISFEYRYTINIILTDFAGHPDSVMVPLLAWLAVHQHELLANPDRRGLIAFDAELLDNSKVDLSIKIPLTERVGVIARDDGSGYDVEHFPEPPLIADMIDPGQLPMLEVRHWKIHAGGEVIAVFDTPAA